MLGPILGKPKGRHTVMRCHMCCRGVPRTPMGLCAVGEPLGTCANCSAFACGHHGARLVRGTFLCIFCEPQIQAAAAGAQGLTFREWVAQQKAAPGGLGDPAVTGVAVQLVRLAEPDFATVAGRAAGGAAAPHLPMTLTEWVRDHPDYGPAFKTWLEARADNLHKQVDARAKDPAARAHPEHGPYLKFWTAVGPEAQRLLAAALALLVGTETPAEELPDVLGAVARAYGVALATSRHAGDGDPASLRVITSASGGAG
ncbi:hypothetical protein SAMN05660359_04469 [Geodermatophilus obscurus]|uniref:Uncharacterized protein n=1 Tax=Geodermatophilus obscurus TaxID=1861 RepID=A0A1I5IBN3_9ACTN|nr:hypothetical protein SAMN05660359_04469 [Geodermatophilus obscurus]